MFVVVSVCTYIISRKEYEDWTYEMLVMISMDLIGMMFCILLLITLILDSMHTVESTYFSMLVVELFLLFFANFLYRGMEGMEEYNPFTVASYYAVYLMIPIVLFTVWVYIKNVTDRYNSRLETMNLVMIVILVAGVVLLVSNLFLDGFYIVDENYYFHNGDLFYVPYMMPIAMIGMIILGITFYLSDRRTKIFLYFFVLVPLIASLMDIFLLTINVLFISMLFALMGLYVNFYIGRSTDLVKKDAQLVQQRAEIMVSQVQPHFLYNALTSIMNIKGNPPETRDAISDFGKYLRGNLDTLKQKGPIAVMLEIEHVKNFMELVKLNGGDDINLELDIHDGNFLIPGLTLQSIFENLVELGFANEPPKGIMKISCFSKDDRHHVIVSDDSGLVRKCEILAGGNIVEFGLNAVKVRLHEMLGGTIAFRDLDGSTVIEVVIPRGTPQR